MIIKSIDKPSVPWGQPIVTVAYGLERQMCVDTEGRLKSAGLVSKGRTKRIENTAAEQHDTVQRTALVPKERENV